MMGVRIELHLMVNKKNFSKVNLNILSVIAVIISFVFLFTTFRNYDGAFVKYLVTTSSLAAVSSYVLIMLIRLGAKADNKLAGIPQKNKRVLYTLLAYLVIPLSCAAIIGILNLISLTGFTQTSTGRDVGTMFGFFAMFAFLPFVFGSVFIYLGAIVSAISRWVASLIWRESETEM
jgi:hypothetical protein